MPTGNELRIEALNIVLCLLAQRVGTVTAKLRSDSGAEHYLAVAAELENIAAAELVCLTMLAEEAGL